MSDSVENLSVKELKEILQKRGVNYADCFEKSDLIRRVQETGWYETIITNIKKRPKKVHKKQARIQLEKRLEVCIAMS